MQTVRYSRAKHQDTERFGVWRQFFASINICLLGQYILMFAITETRSDTLILAIILLNPFGVWKNIYKKKGRAKEERAVSVHGLSLS